MGFLEDRDVWKKGGGGQNESFMSERGEDQLSGMSRRQSSWHYKKAISWEFYYQVTSVPTDGRRRIQI